MLTSFQKKYRIIKYLSDLPLENMICKHDVPWTRVAYCCKAKKKWSCFWKSTGGKTFYHSYTRTVKCVSEYIYLMSKKQTNKKQNKTRTQKSKENKEEKRISLENRKMNLRPPG